MPGREPYSLKRRLFVVFGLEADGVKEAPVGVGKRDAPACHDARGDVEEFCHRDVGEASGGAPFAE